MQLTLHWLSAQIWKYTQKNNKNDNNKRTCIAPQGRNFRGADNNTDVTSRGNIPIDVKHSRGNPNNGVKRSKARGRKTSMEKPSMKSADKQTYGHNLGSRVPYIRCLSSRPYTYLMFVTPTLDNNRCLWHKVQQS